MKTRLHAHTVVATLAGRAAPQAQPLRTVQTRAGGFGAAALSLAIAELCLRFAPRCERESIVFIFYRYFWVEVLGDS